MTGPAWGAEEGVPSRGTQLHQGLADISRGLGHGPSLAYMVSACHHLRETTQVVGSAEIHT